VRRRKLPHSITQILLIHAVWWKKILSARNPRRPSNSSMRLFSAIGGESAVRNRGVDTRAKSNPASRKKGQAE
jgi:hypothetical protein